MKDEIFDGHKSTRYTCMDIIRDSYATLRVLKFFVYKREYDKSNEVHLKTEHTVSFESYIFYFYTDMSL